MQKVWPPDFKVFPAREEVYTFILKAGEMATDYFIHVADDCSFVSLNGKYEIIPRHGKIIKVWNGEKIPPNIGEFKIKAIADTWVDLKIGNL